MNSSLYYLAASRHLQEERRSPKLWHPRSSEYKYAAVLVHQCWNTTDIPLVLYSIIHLFKVKVYEQFTLLSSCQPTFVGREKKPKTMACPQLRIQICSNAGPPMLEIKALFSDSSRNFPRVFLNFFFQLKDPKPSSRR